MSDKNDMSVDTMYYFIRYWTPGIRRIYFQIKAYKDE